MRKVSMYLWLPAVACLLLALGYGLGRWHREQTANDLLSVGFTIIDPEGHEVYWFED